MTLEILICTIDEGLARVPSMMLPPVEGIQYLVSCQYTESRPMVPPVLNEREDVRVIFLEGRGLARNRNWALAHAQGDILQIADDDEGLELAWELDMMDYYAKNPQVDIAHLMMQGTQKRYPASYVSSVELTCRRSSIERAGIRFDERFGLGSECLAGGEEDVFLHDARQAGLQVEFVPRPLCTITGATTGDTFLTNERMQRTKGAVACYTRGKAYAYCRCLRESLWWMIHRGANPIPLFCNMCKGVRYV